MIINVLERRVRLLKQLEHAGHGVTVHSPVVQSVSRWALIIFCRSCQLQDESALMCWVWIHIFVWCWNLPVPVMIRVPFVLSTGSTHHDRQLLPCKWKGRAESEASVSILWTSKWCFNYGSSKRPHFTWVKCDKIGTQSFLSFYVSMASSFRHMWVDGAGFPILSLLRNYGI